ncbi:reverse transcriptase domain-containing protein [Tanacetum coccineum]|uniref:Reverse transcriptase domain-containing protein n=1 Tax=Tanacetum coccineum TaxID=301880 RepID=A0ABQ4YII7_9ASTR
MNSYHPLLRGEQEWYLANASVTPTIEKLFFLRGPYRSDTGNQAYELHHQTYVYGYGPLYAQLARSKELESRNIPRARQVLHAVNILDWGTSDHLSRLKNPDLGKLTSAEIRDLFLEEQLMLISNGKEEPWAMKKYEVVHRFSTAYHPQINGQVKNTNRAIKQILDETGRNGPKS